METTRPVYAGNAIRVGYGFLPMSRYLPLTRVQAERLAPACRVIHCGKRGDGIANSSERMKANV